MKKEANIPEDSLNYQDIKLFNDLYYEFAIYDCKGATILFPDLIKSSCSIFTLSMIHPDHISSVRNASTICPTIWLVHSGSQVLVSIDNKYA